MIMKIRTIALTALAAVTFASCSKDSNGGDDNGISTATKSVAVKIGGNLDVSSLGTRAESLPVTASTTVTFGSGHLLFVSGGKTITQYYTVTNAPTAGTNLDIADLIAGYTIQNVPDNSREVYILSNLPASITFFGTSPVGKPISTVKALPVNVREIGNAAGDVTQVPLYGFGAITESTPGADDWSATFNVAAIGSRVEIAKLTAASDLSNYQVDGIFVNNYYDEMTVDLTVKLGNPPTGDLINNGTEDAGNTKYVGGSTYYPSGLPLWDYNTSGLAPVVANVCEPTTAGNVWGYNVFPGKGTSVATRDTPRIIVRITGATATDGTVLANPSFLTVKSFNGGALNAFAAGNVYTVQNLAFSKDDLTDKPEIGVFDVDVDVTVLNWVPNNVTADL